MAATSSAPDSSPSSHTPMAPDLPEFPPPVLAPPGPGSDALVRLLFADLSGQRRVRVVPYARFRSLVASQGVGLARCIYGFASGADGPAPGCGLSAVGEVRLVPDVRTLRRLPWCPAHLVALVDAREGGRPFAVCPRGVLRRVAGALHDKYGLVLRAGFESEFTLLAATAPSLVPADRSMYCSSGAFDAQGELMAAILAALHGMGIAVEQLHAESGGGQFEVAVAHAADVAAADRILLVREAISGVVRRHTALPKPTDGAPQQQQPPPQPLHATFLPQVFRNEAANGSHVHLSLWRHVSADASSAAAAAGIPTLVDPDDGRTFVNAFTAGGGGDLGAAAGAAAAGNRPERFGLSVEGESFMAGVLAHLPAIMALSCPLPNSYERLGPNKWTGAFLCWGQENREAAVRLACPPDASAAAATASAAPRATNFEVKACDACAQPHLVLAAVIAAGMDGLDQGLQLPDPCDVNPADLPQASAPPRLPVSLEEAVAALEADAVIGAALGAPMLQAVLAVRKAEINHYTGRASMVNQLVLKY